MAAAPLNLLIVGPYPRQLDKVVGGVEAVNATLTPALAAQPEIGCITVASFQPDQRRPQHVQLGEKLHVWQLPGPRRPLLTRALLEVWQVRRLVAAVRPDLVHGHGITVQGEIATRLGLPTVITVHGLGHVESGLIAGSLHRQLRIRAVNATVRRVLRRADVVISISDYDSRALNGLIRGQQLRIANPIAPVFFAQPRFDADGPQLLFAGVLKPRKNVEGLLRAFALVREQVPAARLTIVGPTPYQGYLQRLQQLVGQLKLDQAVRFLGHVETERLVQELRAALAVVLFSHEETSPTILAQAQGLGKPVVSTSVGGIPELISQNETGFLVEPGDEQALAARLTQLLRDPALCAELGRRGHAVARQRSEPQAVARQTLAAYRLALARQRG